MLGKAITEAKNAGKTINTTSLKPYVEEAKTFFTNQVNIPAAEKAIKEINTIYSSFIKKFGNELPIEKAQQLEVSTGQALKKYYNTMSSASIEGEKQLVRGLKEKIVEAAPQVGDINKRHQSLYIFDQTLEKSMGRIGNLNLMGLPSKIAA